MQPHTTRANYDSERGWARAALVSIIGAVVALTALLGGTRPAQALPPWIVNDAGDTIDIAPGDGACKTATSSCTLRAAIMEANAWAGSESILFAIPGGGVHTIFPGTGAPGPLPSITPGSVIIDGTTQPGYAGTPLIEINGSFAGGGANGIALASSGNTVKGLAINRFGFAGVHMSGSSNILLSSMIGTDPTGTGAIPNGTGVALYGSSNTVGAVGAGNTISGNTSSGVLIDASSGNVLRANRIGTNAAGTAGIANGFGVFIRNGATANFVGGDYTLGNANIISGNTSYGIWIDGAASVFNLVEGNAIGTNASGSAAVPNGTGVYVSGAAGIGIGCGSIGFGCSSPNFGNLISGNVSDGVHIGAAATSVFLSGNGIGLNLAGTAAIPNGGVGVRVDGAANILTIGGTGGAALGDRNYISGNLGGGIVIDGIGTYNTQVLGNYIGTNAAGSAAVANVGDGVRISSGATFNGIGDGTAGGRNVISGNTIIGVNVQSPGSDSNTVKGNYVGTDATGGAAIPNGAGGVLIGNGDANAVGGATAAEGNVVSSNLPCNVCVYGPATNTDVRNNLVGTNATATGTLLGSSWGVLVGSDPSGTTAINDNTIGGNGIGIYVTGSDGGGVFHGSNNIGTDPTGTIALANTGAGIYLDAGSTNWRFVNNKVAFNLGSGIAVGGAGTVRNFFSTNEIRDNGGLGIDLNLDGIANPNDPKDPDAGPNFMQNRPVIVAASAAGGSTAVSITLNSTPNKTFYLDVYASSSCDPSGFGEGAVPLGIGGSASTDSNGDVNVGTLVGAAAPGSAITALVHVAEIGDPAYLSTSEFSNCVTVAAACAGDTDCDGKLDALPDNCVTFFNPTQSNSDSGPLAFAGGSGDIDNGIGIAANDVTIPNGDTAGDPCDPDRDNDGIPDGVDSEPLLVSSCGGLFVGATDGHANPAYGDNTDTDGNGPSWDTDKDGRRDGVECELGFNPRSAASKPSDAQCANYHTGGVGPKTALTDLDGDGLPAYDEYCKWGTEDDPAYAGLPYAQDFDGDGRKDCVEANDTNGDAVQNFPGDTVNSAKAANNIIQKTLDFDLNGDGVVNFPGDTILSAKMVNHVGGICP